MNPDPNPNPKPNNPNQWNEYNWSATSGGKFEAFRSQSSHAKLNTAKTKHF